MRDEIIIHTECGCLFNSGVMDDNCRKRYFHVLDIENGVKKYIGVCNQYLGLLINEKRVSKSNNQNNEHFSIYDYQDIVKEIINDHINIPYSKYNYRQNDLSERDITYTVLKRPHIWGRINLIDAIEMQFNNPNFYLKGKVISEVRNYLLSKSVYKKYKTKYRHCFTLIRKYDKSYCKQEEELIINEILKEILELNIKTKQL